MIEAIALIAALLAADATVRESDEFACWCEVVRFGPPPMALAKAHMEWLEARQEQDPDINPGIERLICEQATVLRVYGLVEIVLSRPYAEGDWGRLEKLRELIGDDDYFAGRLPAPVTSMRTRESE